MLRFFQAVTALTLTIVLMLPAAAAPLTTADQQEIRNFTLTTDFLQHALDISRQAKTRKLSPKLDLAHADSLDAMAAQLNARPKVRALLARHEFTAHEYLVGSFALMRAGMTAMMRSDPDQAKYIDPDQVNEANVAFVQAHKAQVNEFFSGTGNHASANDK